MAMSAMMGAGLDNNFLEPNQYRRPSRNAGYKNTFVPKQPPKPDSLKDWVAYGYWVVAATKKAAAKKIITSMTRDNTLGSLTLKDVLKEIKQHN